MHDIIPVRITARVEMPVDGGVTIEPRGQAAWCEANVERITAAIEAESATHRAVVKRSRTVTDPRGQAALFAE